MRLVNLPNWFLNAPKSMELLVGDVQEFGVMKDTFDSIHNDDLFFQSVFAVKSNNFNNPYTLIWVEQGESLGAIEQEIEIESLVETEIIWRYDFETEYFVKY